MKNTGITRKVDDMGRIVLPMELRRNMGIAEGDALEISVDGGNIVLSPVAIPRSTPLTRKELMKREWKPVFAKDKGAHGVKEWLVVCSVSTWGVLSTGGKEYAFCDFDFYDKEV